MKKALITGINGQDGSYLTEFLSNKCEKKSNVVMLIYNKQLSVSPVTTHIPLSQVPKKINQNIMKTYSHTYIWGNFAPFLPTYCVCKDINFHSFSFFSFLFSSKWQSRPMSCELLGS